MTDFSRRAAMSGALVGAWLLAARDSFAQELPSDGPGGRGRLALETFVNALTTKEGQIVYGSALAEGEEIYVREALENMGIVDLIPERIDVIVEHWLVLRDPTPPVDGLTTLKNIFRGFYGIPLNQEGPVPLC